jgi:hypothetical protein
MKLILSFILFVMVLLSGCHEVTEYLSADHSNLTFIRTSDYQIDRTMDGLSQGRTLLSYGTSGLILLSSDGTLTRINYEEMVIDTSYTIGGSSGTGYTDAVIAGNGNLYVLGPGSQVIEVDLSNNSVVDQFYPGSDPGAICASYSLPRLYFTDSAEDYIGEIWTSDNRTGFTSATVHPLTDLMVDRTGGRHIIAVSSGDQGYIYGIWLDISESTRLLPVSAGSPCSAIISLEQDSVYAVSCPVWAGDNGYLYFVQGYENPDSTRFADVQGHPTDMCFNSNTGHMGNLSVLGKTNSGSTVVTVFEFPYVLYEPHTASVISIDGFPRDVISPSTGEYLIVLTSD